VVYVDTVWDLRSLDTYRPPARRNPAHSTALGKVLLAELSSAQLERFVVEKGLVPRTARTITNMPGLTAELERVRMLGYATDAGENSEDARYYAAPVRDYTERAVAAVSVAGDTQSFPDTRWQELISLVLETAGRLSARLGYAAEGLAGAAAPAGGGGHAGVRPPGAVPL
jgi:DNA-binding IclR family transcriptional regulator